LQRIAVHDSAGTGIEDIVSLAEEQGVSVNQAQAEAEQAAQVDPNEAFGTVPEGSWWALPGLVLPLAAASAGAAPGHDERGDVIQAGRQDRYFPLQRLEPGDWAFLLVPGTEHSSHSFGFTRKGPKHGRHEQYLEHHRRYGCRGRR
jgi:hypothetical protein